MGDWQANLLAHMSGKTSDLSQPLNSNTPRLPYGAELLRLDLDMALGGCGVRKPPFFPTFKLRKVSKCPLRDCASPGSHSGRLTHCSGLVLVCQLLRLPCSVDVILHLSQSLQKFAGSQGSQCTAPGLSER